MRACTDCAHAEWVKTSAGRLHPKGSGMCRFPYKLPALPLAFHWHNIITPRPLGGAISRRSEMPDRCPCFQRAKDPK